MSMLRVLRREARVNPVSHQLLVHSLTEKWTQELGGFRFVFFVSPLDNKTQGLKHVPFLSPSPHVHGFQLLFQPPQQRQALWVHSKPPLLTAVIPSEHAQQEWFGIIPIHLEKKPRELQLPHRRVHRLAGARGGVYVCVWVATGAWRHSPAHCPLQMTLVSLSLEILVSPVILQGYLNTQFAGGARPVS